MPTLWEIESDFIRLIYKLKQTGIKIDREFCYPKIKQGDEILDSIKSELGWNPASPKQLGKFLLEDMGYPVLERTDKGNPSFNKSAMEKYDELLANDDSPVANQVFRYRGWQKTVSSNYRPYIRLADKNDILHPNYKVHGTKTCRLSCELPNLQQIPRSSGNEWNGDLKHAFIPEFDNRILIEFDFSQLEFRLAAVYARELELLEIFNSDADIFDEMASRLGWTRQDIKTLCYATIYGSGIKGLAKTFGINREAAADRYNEFHSTWPGFKKISDRATHVMKNQGYVEYWSGRRRHIKNRNDHHKAFNSTVQGGAFEIVKRSGLRLNEKMFNDHKMRLTVHDSYLLEMPVADYNDKVCKKISSILEDVPESKELGVKFRTEYKIWGEK